MAATRIPFQSPNTWAIIPHDTDSFSPPLSAVFIGGATGDIVIRHLVASGNNKAVATDTFSSVPAGTVITGIGPIVGVNSTSTTATGIIGVS